MVNRRIRADLALVLCTLIWGVTFVIVKDALADISVLAFLAVRFALAAVLMALMFRGSIARLDRRGVWAGMQIGLCMFGGFLFQTAGLRRTTPSKAAFITGSSVVLVPFLLAAFRQRRIGAWTWVAVTIAFAGLYFLTVPRQGFSGLDRGDPLVFVCAILFALQIILISRYVERYSVGGLSFLQVAATAALSIVLLPLAARTGWEPLRIVWNGNVVFAVLVTAIGATAIATPLQTWGQKHTSASHAAIFFSLEPVFAAITSLVLGRERLGARGFTGAALVFAGILMAEFKSAGPVAPESVEPAAPSHE
jgi:drug/metabolite transporter (DMT)-like permease